MLWVLQIETSFRMPSASSFSCLLLCTTEFSPIPAHPWTSSLCSISPLLSSLLVIRPANFNLLPRWVGCTSGTYFAGGTISLFTPCTGRYEETLTICFHQQKQPVSVNMQAFSTTTLQWEVLCEGRNFRVLQWLVCSAYLMIKVVVKINI